LDAVLYLFHVVFFYNLVFRLTYAGGKRRDSTRERKRAGKGGKIERERLCVSEKHREIKSR